VTLIIDSDGA